MRKIQEVTNQEALFIAGGILGIGEILERIGFAEDQTKESAIAVGYASVLMERCHDYMVRSEPEILANFASSISDLYSGGWDCKRFEMKARKAAKDYIKFQQDSSDLSGTSIMGAFSLARLSSDDIEKEEMMLKRFHGAETPEDLISMDRQLEQGATLIPNFLNRRLSVLKTIFSSMERKENSNWIIVDYGKILSMPERRHSLIGRVPARMELELFGTIPMLERALDAMDWDRVLNPMIDKFCVDSLHVAGVSNEGFPSIANPNIVNSEVLSPTGLLGYGFTLSTGLGENSLDHFVATGLSGQSSKAGSTEDDSQDLEDDLSDQHEDDLIALNAISANDDLDDEGAEESGEFPMLNQPMGPALQWEGSLLARVRSLDVIKKEATVQIEGGDDEITIPLSMKNLRKIADTLKQDGDAPILVDAQVCLEPYWRVVSVELSRPIQTEEEMIANSDFL